MATLAHSYTTERQAFHRPRARSADQIAIERWGGRQLRLAQSVAAFLDEIHEGEWRWEASDNFFGTPVDSAVITGLTPNGDGTHSGIIMVGDMDILGPLLRATGMEIHQPKSAAEALLEQIHWLDDFWGPLPLPYHLTQWIEEIDMPKETQTPSVDKPASKANIRTQLEENWLLLGVVLGLFVFFWNRTDRLEDRVETKASQESVSGLVSKDYVDGEFKATRAEIKGQFDLVNLRLDLSGVPRPPTSTDNGSSTPPTATDDPAKR